MRELSNEVKQKFIKLNNSLQDENLYEDGEISHHEANQKEVRLKNQWKKLEYEQNVKVTEEMCWKWHDELFTTFED